MVFHDVFSCSDASLGASFGASFIKIRWKGGQNGRKQVFITSLVFFVLFDGVPCVGVVRRLSLLHGWWFVVGVSVSVVVHRLSLVHGWPLLLFGIDVVLVLNVWILCPFPFFSLCLVMTLCFSAGCCASSRFYHFLLLLFLCSCSILLLPFLFAR